MCPGEQLVDREVTVVHESLTQLLKLLVRYLATRPCSEQQSGAPRVEPLSPNED